MAGETTFGKAVHAAAHILLTRDATFTVNGTQTYICGGVGGGQPGKYRINRAWIMCNAIPSDADGTLLANLFVRDDSEGASDQLIVSQDLETLVVTANKWFPLTLAAETSEKERTIEAFDAMWFTVVNNSAAIDTNPQSQFMVELIPLPTFTDDVVKYEGSY